MIIKYQTENGNFAYCKQNTTDNTLPIVMIVSPSNQLIGGFLGKNAIVKFRFYSRHAKMICLHKEFPPINSLDLSVIAKITGKAFRYVKTYGEFIINDEIVHGAKYFYKENGTPSEGSVCLARHNYYKNVGLNVMIKNDKISFPLWALILNHISVFGVDNFKESFGNQSSKVHDREISYHFSHKVNKRSFGKPNGYNNVRKVNKLPNAFCQIVVGSYLQKKRKGN